MRPGICRTCSMRVVMKPKYGPPEDSGTPSGCPSPQTMSTPLLPHSPGGFNTASEVGLTTAITSMPAACARSVSTSTSSSVPKKFGCWMTSAVMSSPLYLSSDATVRCPPRASYGRISTPRFWLAAMGAHRHQAGLCHCRGAVVERCIAHLHPGEARHHRLEFVDELQRALARLRLVRRVRAVELAAGHDRPDRGRDVMLVGARPDEVEPPDVARGALLHQPADLHLGEPRRDRLERSGAQLARDLVEQRLDVGHPDGREHLAHVVGGVRNEGHVRVPASVRFSGERGLVGLRIE